MKHINWTDRVPVWRSFGK